MIAGGKPNLIGISGKMGSGKDLLYNMLCELSDIDFENKKFAYPIKWIIAVLIGCDIRQLEDREFKEKELGEEWTKYRIITKGLPNYYVSTLQEAEDNTRHSNQRYVKVVMTPRLLLQLLGTEAGREIIHPNIWVNALFADYKDEWVDSGDSVAEEDVSKVLKEPNWIITDVRFLNEAQAIKDRGGILIRINRPQLIERDFEHLSETALDDYDGFDYVIENNSDSVADLVEQVKQLKIV